MDVKRFEHNDGVLAKTPSTQFSDQDDVTPVSICKKPLLRTRLQSTKTEPFFPDFSQSVKEVSSEKENQNKSNFPLKELYCISSLPQASTHEKAYKFSLFLDDVVEKNNQLEASAGKDNSSNDDQLRKEVFSLLDE